MSDAQQCPAHDIREIHVASCAFLSEWQYVPEWRRHSTREFAVQLGISTNSDAARRHMLQEWSHKASIAMQEVQGKDHRGMPQWMSVKQGFAGCGS